MILSDMPFAPFCEKLMLHETVTPLPDTQLIVERMQVVEEGHVLVSCFHIRIITFAPSMIKD